MHVVRVARTACVHTRSCVESHSLSRAINLVTLNPPRVPDYIIINIIIPRIDFGRRRVRTSGVCLSNVVYIVQSTVRYVMQAHHVWNCVRC